MLLVEVKRILSETVAWHGGNVLVMGLELLPNSEFGVLGFFFKYSDHFTHCVIFQAGLWCSNLNKRIYWDLSFFFQRIDLNCFMLTVTGISR